MDVCLVSRTARFVLLGVVIALGVLDGAGSGETSTAARAQPVPDSTIVATDRPLDPAVEAPMQLSAVSGGVD